MIFVHSYNFFYKLKTGYFLKNCSLRGCSLLTKVSYSKCNHSINIVTIDETRKFIINCFKAVGLTKQNSMAMSELLIDADYRGHYSEGLARIEKYIKDIRTKSVNVNAKLLILNETPATAWIDGNNGLGPLTANFCMSKAIEKAKCVGFSYVTAKKSNYIGLIGHYLTKAINERIIAIVLSNSSPYLVPTRSKIPMIGANPIGFGVKTNDSDYQIDMSITALSPEKLEIKKINNETLPSNLVIDLDGREIKDPNLAYKRKHFMPLSGNEISGGYKGYGLGAVFEILTGLMAGSAYSTHLKKTNERKNDNVGHAFFAWDPKYFSPDFEVRISDFINRLRGTKPIDPKNPVIVAGDIEKKHIKEVDKLGGFLYPPELILKCHEIASVLQIRKIRLSQKN